MKLMFGGRNLSAIAILAVFCMGATIVKVNGTVLKNRQSSTVYQLSESKGKDLLSIFLKSDFNHSYFLHYWVNQSNLEVFVFINESLKV